MIGGPPENTKEALGRAILHTVEMLAAGTLAAAVLAVVFLVLAIRNAAAAGRSTARSLSCWAAPLSSRRPSSSSPSELEALIGRLKVG